MNAEEMLAKRERLLRLAVEVDQELAAIEAGLRIHKSKPGRPRVPYTMTEDEARHARAAHKRGEVTPWTLQGKREYDRRTSRARRTRAAQ